MARKLMPLIMVFSLVLLSLTGLAQAAGAPDKVVKVGGPDSGVVGSTLKLKFEVQDADGKPVGAGEDVTLTVIKGGGHFLKNGNQRFRVTEKTDENGQVEVEYVLGNVAGNFEDNYQNNEITVAIKVETGEEKAFHFKFGALPGAPYFIEKVSGDNQIGVVNTRLPAPLGVIVKDKYDNPVVSGYSVKFEATGGELSTGEVKTDNYGRASVMFKLGSASGDYTIKAYLADNSGIKAEFKATAVEVVALVPYSIIVPTDVVGTANVPSFMNVEVLDENNNPVSGWDVDVSVIEGPAVLPGDSTSLTLTTNTSGKAEFYLIAKQPSQDGKWKSRIQVSFIRFDKDQGKWTRDVQTFTYDVVVATSLEKDKNVPIESEVGKTVDLTVYVKDADENGVGNVNVAFSITSSPENSKPKLSAESIWTDTTGKATVTLTLGEVMGDYEVKARANLWDSDSQKWSEKSVTFTIYAKKPSEAIKPLAVKTVAGDDQTGVVGSVLPQALTVEVTDKEGNRITLGEVTFKVARYPKGGSKGSFMTGDEIGDGYAKVALDRNGRASTSFRLGESVGSEINPEGKYRYEITATINGVSTAFTLWAVPGPLAKLRKVGFEKPEELDIEENEAILGVQITDKYDNPITGSAADGVTATFEVIEGDWTLGSTTAGVDKETGIAKVVITKGTTLHCKVDAYVTTVQSGVTVRLSDYEATPFTLSTKKLGELKIVAVEPESKKVQGAVGYPSQEGATEGSYYAHPTYPIRVQVKREIESWDWETGSKKTIEIPASDETVTFSVDDTSIASVGANMAKTDENGWVGVGIKIGKKYGTTNLNISVDDKKETVTIEALKKDPTTMAAVVNGHEVAVADIKNGEKEYDFGSNFNPGAELTLTVRVKDGYGNLIEGVNVKFEQKKGEGTLTNDVVSTEADGTASVTYKLSDKYDTQHTVEATVEVKVKADDKTEDKTLKITFKAKTKTKPAPPPPAPSEIQIVSGDNQKGVVNAALSKPLKVKVVDKDGKPWQGEVTFVAIEPKDKLGHFENGKAVTKVSTDADGIASARFWLGTLAWTSLDKPDPNAITDKVEVYIENYKDVQHVFFEATASPGDPAEITLKFANGETQTRMPADGKTQVNIIADVKDQFKNPTLGSENGIKVSFEVGDGLGSIVPSLSEEKEGNYGRYETAYYAGSFRDPRVIAKETTITATVVDDMGYPIDNVSGTLTVLLRNVNITVNVGKETLKAGESTGIDVRVADLSGNPRINDVVEISPVVEVKDKKGNVIEELIVGSLSSVIPERDGHYTATYTAPSFLEGEKELKLKVTVSNGEGNSLTVTKTITLQPDIEYVVDLTADKTKLLADGKDKATLTIKVKDKKTGLPVDGEPAVEVTQGKGTIGAPQKVKTGEWTVTYTSGDSPGVVTIAAKVGNAQDTLNLVLTDTIPQDLIPPTFQPIAPISAVAGEDVAVSAKVVDNVKVGSVKLYYRIGGTTKWCSIEMEYNENTGSYETTIPGGSVGIAGLSYYLEATDTMGNVSTYGSPEEPINIPVTGDIQAVREKTLEGGGYAKYQLPPLREDGHFEQFTAENPKWYMISFPVDTSQSLNEALPSDGWFRYRWNREEGKWEFIKSDAQIGPTEGLVVAAIGGDKTLQISGTSRDVTRKYAISLKNGWNLIGNPFSFGRYWDDDTISVRKDGVEVPITEASSRGWVYHTIWWISLSGPEGDIGGRYYDAASADPRVPNQSWEVDGDPDTQFPTAIGPFGAFFVLAFTDCELLVSPTSHGPDEVPVPVTTAPKIAASKPLPILDVRPPVLPIFERPVKVEQTAVFQNYPNPFNPDTWIPYQLSKDADVMIRIFDLKGQLIRTLRIGRRQAGYYLDRSKAAYWDGHNELGERVSSGVYFYQLQAGKFKSPMVKMVILK